LDNFKKYKSSFEKSRKITVFNGRHEYQDESHQRGPVVKKNLQSSHKASLATTVHTTVAGRPVLKGGATVPSRG